MFAAWKRYVTSVLFSLSVRSSSVMKASFTRYHLSSLLSSEKRISEYGARVIALMNVSPLVYADNSSVIFVSASVKERASTTNTSVTFSHVRLPLFCRNGLWFQTMLMFYFSCCFFFIEYDLIRRASHLIVLVVVGLFVAEPPVVV